MGAQQTWASVNAIVVEMPESRTNLPVFHVEKVLLISESSLKIVSPSLRPFKGEGERISTLRHNICVIISKQKLPKEAKHNASPAILVYVPGTDNASIVH